MDSHKQQVTLRFNIFALKTALVLTNFRLKTDIDTVKELGKNTDYVHL